MSLESEEIHQLLEWAIDWQHDISRNSTPDAFEASERSSSPWARHRSNYAFEKLAQETFPLYDLGIAPSDIMSDVMGIIQDLAFESDAEVDWDEYHYPVEESIEEDGLVSTYEAKVNQVIAEIGQGEQLETIFYFPLNIQWAGSPPEIEIFDITFQPISESEWSEQLSEFRRYPDTFGTGTVESLCEDTDYSYWTTTIQSKGRSYAANKLNTALNLLCAKINHTLYCWEIQRLSERDQSSPGNPRWSWIQEPMAVLTAGTDHPLEVAITNRSSPRTVDLDWTNGDLPERFEEIPSFNYGADGLAGIFQDALLEYQRAMLETERQNAFFGFWRCIEELTLAGHGEKSEIVDRAMWAYSVSASEAHEIFFKTITEQLYDTRNKWVHEANWGDIWEIHERVAKYLADSLIQLYIDDFYGLDQNVVAEAFRYARMEEPQREKKQRQAEQRLEALNELNNIEQDCP